MMQKSLGTVLQDGVTVKQTIAALKNGLPGNEGVFQAGSQLVKLEVQLDPNSIESIEILNLVWYLGIMILLFQQRAPLRAVLADLSPGTN